MKEPEPAPPSPAMQAIDQVIQRVYGFAFVTIPVMAWSALVGLAGYELGHSYNLW